MIQQKAKRAFMEIITYDQNGEVISTSSKKVVSKNGSGFVLSYTDKMTDFLVKTKAGSTVRVFMFIAHNQQYGFNGEFGFRCTHNLIQKTLQLDRKSVYNALSYLKDEFLVHELKIHGQSEFMVNPHYITVGTDRKARITEWNKRWANQWKES